MPPSVIICDGVFQKLFLDSPGKGPGKLETPWINIPKKSQTSLSMKLRRTDIIDTNMLHRRAISWWLQDRVL